MMSGSSETNSKVESAENAENTEKAENGAAETKQDSSRRTSRGVKRFSFSQNEEEEQSPQARKKPRTSKSNEKLVTYRKSDFVTVRNEHGTYYLCKLSHNTYEDSSRVRIQWLDEDKTQPGIYAFDYADSINPDSIVCQVHPTSLGKNRFQMKDEDVEKTQKILAKVLKGETVFSDQIEAPPKNDKVEARTITPAPDTDVELDVEEQEEPKKKKKATKRKSKSSPKKDKPQKPLLKKKKTRRPRLKKRVSSKLLTNQIYLPFATLSG